MSVNYSCHTSQHEFQAFMSGKSQLVRKVEKLADSSHKLSKKTISKNPGE